MNVYLLLFVAVLSLFTSGSIVSSASTTQTQFTVTATNRLKVARESETIEVNAQALARLAEKDLMKLHVFDSSGKEILSQAVDTDYDEYHKPDILIFQADFAPNESKTFTVTAGKKREYKKEDFRAYGRFVRERFDDFAWENDRVGHRTYGKALRTWKGEPLTSSAIDTTMIAMTSNRWISPPIVVPETRPSSQRTSSAYRQNRCSGGDADPWLDLPYHTISPSNPIANTAWSSVASEISSSRSP